MRKSLLFSVCVLIVANCSISFGSTSVIEPQWAEFCPPLYENATFKHAKENSKKCIFDPICINHDKACAGCLFLNEVSCQHFNKDLDRSYLCGHYDVQAQKKIKGYWEN